MMSRRCGSSKSTPTPLTAWLWSQEHANQSSGAKTDPTTRHKPPTENLPRTAGVVGETPKKLQNLLHTAGVAEGGRKGSTVTNQPQKRCTREKSYQEPPADHRHGRGLDEETTNNRDEGWHHLQPREGGVCWAGKKGRTNTTHTKIEMAKRPVHYPVPRYAQTRVPWAPPASGLRRASAGRN